MVELSDRHLSLTVALECGTQGDGAEQIMNAIRMICGVASVTVEQERTLYGVILSAPLDGE